MSLRTGALRAPRRAHALVLAAAATAAALLVGVVGPAPAEAVTTGNGALVYSPAAGTSFNPEGGRAAGTTYAKMVVLKNSGSANGQQFVTFDQLVLENGVQVYPIYRSTNDGTSWSRVATVTPSKQFPALTRTAQPSLYETPIQLGSMPAGTLLLSGMIMPSDRSSSRLVMYKSLDHGLTWSFVSTVDTGGPATYDPSPTSTTSTVWEPSVAVDANGGLVTYFSDERQKAKGVLQAVSYRRSTDGGATWGPLVNVSAPTNTSDRPGMITVTRMPNGNYIATFEVVNRPSRTNNTAPVYYKTSPDGLTWSPETSIGTKLAFADGRGLGSSPEVRWIPEAGNPNGMVVVSSKWSVDASGNIDGGQTFAVNRNQGSGAWEQLPYAVTYDARDTEGGTFSGFAQSFDSSADGKTLYQATNVENLSTTYNDVRVGSVPINALRYEAESATRTDTSTVTQVDAVGGQKVGNINNATSKVQFTVQVPTAGTYTMNVRYDNGTGATSTHTVSVNGGTPSAVSYTPTVNWGRFGWAQKSVTLNAGTNTITFTKGTGFAELDQIQLYR
ncbi:CBM35 domain-containing protein [Curtobacterium oceanosedimentum]|uniref:CBM35 domain-containing protein n=1 Tax=Curtobacterium oceanosedimentum TaxID=465820 RepID=UPI0033930F68